MCQLSRLTELYQEALASARDDMDRLLVEVTFILYSSMLAGNALQCWARVELYKSEGEVKTFLRWRIVLDSYLKLPASLHMECVEDLRSKDQAFVSERAQQFRTKFDRYRSFMVERLDSARDNMSRYRIECPQLLSTIGNLRCSADLDCINEPFVRGFPSFADFPTKVQFAVESFATADAQNDSSVAIFATDDMITDKNLDIAMNIIGETSPENYSNPGPFPGMEIYDEKIGNARSAIFAGHFSRKTGAFLLRDSA
jgi:hypothetical protein